MQTEITPSAAPSAPPVSSAPTVSISPNVGAVASATLQPQQPATPQPAPNINWTEGLSPEFKGMVEAKQWKSVNDMAQSYTNLEKLRGVPAERLLTLPEDLNGPEMEPLRKRLGKPDSADDYKITLAEGTNDDVTKFVKGMFHEAHLTKAQGEVVSAKYTEFFQNLQKGEEAKKIEAHRQEAQALQQKQGAAFGEFEKQADAGMKTLSLSEQDIKALGNIWGYTKTMTMLQTVGAKVSEGQFHTGSTTASPVYSPEAAQYKIKQLGQDKTFMQKVWTKDAAATEEWTRLHEMANPGTLTLGY